MPEWRFRRMHPGEMNIDPVEGEFFSTAALDTITDALVRESIQNSLDARRPGEPARVRIAFPAPASPAAAARWLDGLWPHLAASRSGVGPLPDEGEPLRFLLVEDFGTRGLHGDPGQSEDAEIDAPGARNDFYYFWRNVGRSRKASADLGRWGLGKTVFPAASAMNAFVGLTVRAGDGRALLMGQAVLRIHKIGDARFYPYGYLGEFEQDFAHPVEDGEAIERFRADFSLARGGGEPGLSVLVPWPDPEIAPATVLASAIRHYFVPVLAGDLVVEVASERGTERLDAERLARDDALAGLDLSPREIADLERLIALARFGRDLPRSEHVRLPDPPADAAPRWAPEAFDALPAYVRERFDAGLPLAFTVPVWVKPSAGEAVLCAIEVYLERDDALARGDEHFVREGITIAGVRGGVPKGIRAVVSAHERPIAALLGDAENPAHTEWQERSPKFKDRYRHGPFTLRYVRNAPREIARALTRPAAGRDEGLLRHLFALEVPTEAAVIDAHRRATERAGEGASPPAAEVREGGAAPRFQLQRTRGGFRLLGTGEGETPTHAVVQVAYEVRRGNPFARYQPPDFDLAEPPIAVDAEGLAVERREGNLLVVRIEDPRFRLGVEGFDPHRDVRVRVVPEEAPR